MSAKYIVYAGMYNTYTAALAMVSERKIPEAAR